MIEINCEPDKRITDLLSWAIRDVFPFVKKLSRGTTSLEEFNSQQCDFDNDVVLGTIPRDEITSFLRLYNDDSRIKQVVEIFKESGKNVEYRNFYYYPPNTMMTWHTNSNVIGTRVYYTMVSGGDIFRYRDPVSKEIIDVHGKDGWNVKRFQIGNTKEDLLWHTIYSKGPRFSFGFNLLDN